MRIEYVMVVSTTDSEDTAHSLAANIVKNKLGACVQIVGPITSVFRWNNEVQTEQEWRLEIKTTADRASQVIVHLQQEHNYHTPEIIVLPITDGSAPYLSWLVTETR